MPILLNYTRTETGFIHNNSYHVIDSVNIHHMIDISFAWIEISIYNSKNDFINGKMPINKTKVYADNGGYDTYLTEDAIANSGKTIKEQAELFLLTKTCSNNCAFNYSSGIIDN